MKARKRVPGGRDNFVGFVECPLIGTNDFAEFFPATAQLRAITGKKKRRRCGPLCPGFFAGAAK